MDNATDVGRDNLLAEIRLLSHQAGFAVFVGEKSPIESLRLTIRTLRELLHYRSRIES